MNIEDLRTKVEQVVNQINRDGFIEVHGIKHFVSRIQTRGLLIREKPSSSLEALHRILELWRQAKEDTSLDFQELLEKTDSLFSLVISHLPKPTFASEETYDD